jgi:hypothetical protein
MEIVESEGNFLVMLGGQLLYTALSQEEAQGYIDWKNRPDAGNTPEDCGCNK